MNKKPFRLISFNIWGGTLYKPLMSYLKEESATTDIFCFQEVFSSLPGAPDVSGEARMYLFEELSELLADFRGFFEIRSEGYDFNGRANFPVRHGLAMFARKTLKAGDYSGETVEQAAAGDDPVEALIKAQALSLETAGKKFLIMNFHGVAQPGDKLDTPRRIAHARKLVKIWASRPEAAKILCGDFNMHPDNESIKILDGLGKNLIKQFKIRNTRNEVSWKKYPGSRQTFADYVFVSPEIKVNDFKVPYNEVSDHLPMILEFEV